MTDRPVLSGIRVLDLGWVWAGGVVGQILSDWGADVIKIESTKRLDPARQGRPIIGDTPDPEQNPMFHNVNRGKRSVTIDITTPEGRTLITRLVALSDIVIENMAPHALRNAGLDYAALRAVNERIIMISYPLAGQTGPYNELRGYGPTAGSLTGLDFITGYEDDDQITGFPHAIADPLVGVHGAIAVLAALRHRARTGEGQYIDLSMWESLAACMAIGILDFQLNGRPGSVRGNDHPLYAPHGIYRCADGDEGDQWIAIAVDSEAEWQALCDAMERPDWTRDPAYRDRHERRKNRRRLDEQLNAWTARWKKEDLETSLQERGVAATACRHAQDRYLDVHLRAKQTYVDVEHPVFGMEPLYGNPVRMRRRTAATLTRAPLLGEHTRAVLRDLLEMPDTEIDRLAAEGVLE